MPSRSVLNEAGAEWSRCDQSSRPADGIRPRESDERGRKSRPEFASKRSTRNGPFQATSFEPDYSRIVISIIHNGEPDLQSGTGSRNVHGYPRNLLNTNA